MQTTHVLCLIDNYDETAELAMRAAPVHRQTNARLCECHLFRNMCVCGPTPAIEPQPNGNRQIACD